MQLNIGEKIRELRQRDGRTQQDMADTLGITPQAISRWEVGVAYPDIEIIPKIADYFNVSTDFLYDRAPDVREYEIANVCQTAWRLVKEDKKYREACDLLRDTLKKYPKEYRLMMELSNILHLRSMLREDNFEELGSESIHWAERVLRECSESSLRSDAAFLLKHAYCHNKGMDFKLRQLAESMPSMSLSRENILCYVSNEKEAARNCQQYSQKCLLDLVYFSRWHGENCIAVNRMLIGMIRQFVPEGDYESELYSELFMMYAQTAFLELWHGETEQALDDLEELAVLLEAFYRKTAEETEYVHTSPSLQALPPYRLSVVQMGNFWRYCSDYILEESSIPETVREDVRFLELRERLLTYSPTKQVK